MSHESSPSRRAATVLLPFLLAGCVASPPATPDQQTPQISVSKKTVDELFRAAFVGTVKAPGCLRGKAYDTDLHTTESGQVPNGYQPAISRVANVVTPNNSALMYITPRGNDSQTIELKVTLNNGSLVFASDGPTDFTHDVLATAGCKQSMTVPLWA